MSKHLKSLLYFVNLIFTIVCLIHVSSTLHSTINPPNPEIKVYERALKDISFPILLKVCGKERKDGSKRFRNYGYDGEDDFYSGLSKFNKMIVGWNGHTENGSTIGPLQGKFLAQGMLIVCVSQSSSFLLRYSRGLQAIFLRSSDCLH